MALSSCGSTSPAPQTHDAAVVPDAPLTDAAVPDPDANACACPGTELLSREHLVDVWDSIPDGYIGAYRRCERQTDRAIGGGCSFKDEALAVNDSFSQHSFEYDKIRWLCNRQSITVPVDFFVRCVRPLGRPAQLGDECICPDVETPADRIIQVDETILVPARGIGGADVSCPAGSTLIGGGCYGGHDSFTGDALILGGGIRPEAPDTWHCAWHAPREKPLSSIATAVCLRDPGPDAVTGESVAPEMIEHVHVKQTLAAGETRNIDAICAPGDTLISGGCHVEDARLEIAGLRMKRSSLLPVEDTLTWQCAWSNQTTGTASVVATATCLKPAATSQP
jgi:hypothetical protein